MFVDAKTHYDMLIEENNDPVHDPLPLKEYMDKWDGDGFVDKMKLSKDKIVLEIGVGTGRLALKVIPHCKLFYGIDISPKTIKRAKSNLHQFKNIHLICSDFMTYEFEQRFDIIYSSLTFMHIEDKQTAINKVASLLNKNGAFVLSIDKNQSNYIDMSTRKVKIFPDTPDKTSKYIALSGLSIIHQYETESAFIFVTKK